MDWADRDIWSTADVAAYLDVSPRTIRRWRASGALPYVMTPGGVIKFRSASVKETVERWERR